MYVIIGILAVIILVQAIALWRVKRQIRDICRQLSFLREHDSNMLITHDLRGSSIDELVRILNDFLFDIKKERRSFAQKEKQIADTYTNLSHDIRTPLTSLDGYFQLLEESSDAAEQKRYIDIIQERISSLKNMLEELFTFTKLKDGSYELELSRCCINRVLKETIFSYYEDWTGRGIEPRIELTQEELFIEGNVHALQRVIQNIIKNALDHGEKSLCVELKREENSAVIVIANNVTNADEIDITQVFERFYKQDKSRSQGSTGLGLSIAREFVLRMNGQIKAELVGEEFRIVIEFLCLK